MTAPWVNTIGLLLNIVGVVLLFFFGFPQPTHQEGVHICVEDGTRLADGRTAYHPRFPVSALGHVVVTAGCSRVTRSCGIITRSAGRIW